MASGADLLEVLSRAREQGFLGPGDPADHLEHALGFVEVVETLRGAPPARVADLGTGGGVPGLVLAREWPASAVSLIESSVRRVEWLSAAVETLGLAARVEICPVRAEDLAHDPAYREGFDLVTARGFAAPAATAEIAAGLVAVGGWLVVSEPPAPADRWPEAAVRGLGFDPAVATTARGAHFACLHKARPVAPTVPRRRGRATKRPLWEARST
jgi:16S rRNA (guanine527-N7)-methyltransferase